MAETYYAWSDIVVGTDEGSTVIKAGTKVTSKDLDVDNKGFDEYLLSGAVRPYPYPEMPDTANMQSPVDFMRAKALEGAQAEEERLMALADPELRKVTAGPLESEPVPLADGVEEGKGPPEK